MNRKYMKLALKLASFGRTSPNPRVGCVIVKHGRMISYGYHRKYGGDHAEIEALKKAGRKARNAEMYVTLEPCSHYGKTPPCVDAIIRAGIKKVYIATEDPNPLVFGNGIERLHDNKVKVKIGLMRRESERLNEAYIRYVTDKKPFVTMKSAMSLDGKTATRTGNSKYISGVKSRIIVHKLRNKVDAVMVGINTVLKDNPELTCRLKEGHDPVRIVVDSKLRIPLHANALKDDNVIIATTKKCSKKKKKELERTGIKVLLCGDKKVKLRTLFKKLPKLGIIDVLLEGGSELNTSAIEEKIVDKVLFFVCPKIIGGKDALTPVAGKGVVKIEDALKLYDVKALKLNGDVLVSGYVDYD